MPYSGPDDPGLPANVKSLPANRRAQWVHIWNSTYTACNTRGGSDCESEAFGKANGVALEADNLLTRDIEGVEILREGTWKGVPFTSERLEQMVEAARATEGSFAIPIKLGHAENQKLVQKDGFPAAGWVENLRKVGQKLVADFRRVPVKIAQLIEAGALRKRSSEIRFDMNVGGHKWPAMFVGVALLGVDLPAVDSLEDIRGLYRQVNLDLDSGATGGL